MPPAEKLKKPKRKLKFNQELIQRQLKLIREARGEACTPLEYLRAYAQYIEMIGVDTLIALSLISDPTADEPTVNHR